MNHKTSFILSLSLALLASCSPSQSAPSSPSNPSEKTSNSQQQQPSIVSTKGTYTKLKEGLEAFTTSFTLTKVPIITKNQIKRPMIF